MGATNETYEAARAAREVRARSERRHIWRAGKPDDRSNNTSHRIRPLLHVTVGGYVVRSGSYRWSSNKKHSTAQQKAQHQFGEERRDARWQTKSRGCW